MLIANEEMLKELKDTLDKADLTVYLMAKRAKVAYYTMSLYITGATLRVQRKREAKERRFLKVIKEVMEERGVTPPQWLRELS